jgi:type I restriction enzyme M protein
MAEHLTPTGRAAIIVPEGIIFQSQTAYKELRKMLVENSLVAVVSLPAGCFNPYSGVKTSILILDKSLAKAADTIAFFKVENDGYGLGAQRRAIVKNDLPQVQAELAAYLHALRTKAPTETVLALTSTAQIVLKEKIAANGDYNLSGERYREGAAQSTHFPWRTVESLVETITPPSKIQKTAFGVAGRFPIIDQSQDAIAGWTDDESALIRPTKPLVIFGDHTCAIKLAESPFAQGADGIKILQTIDSLDPRFLFHVLRARPLETSGYQRHFSKLKEHQIPLPPLDVQKEIVAEIEGYQKVINGARAVLDHYRPHIPIHPDWPVEPLSALFATKSGTTPSRSRTDYFQEGTIPWVKTLDLRDGPIRSTDEKITPQALDDTHLSILPVGTVLVAMYGGFNQIGRTGVLEIEATHNQAMTALLPTPRVSPYFLNAILVAAKDYWKTVANSTRKDPNITKTDVLNFKLPLPPLATQQAIVAEIEAEQALVAANRELINRFERKIQATLARIWGESEPASSEP